MEDVNGFGFEVEELEEKEPQKEDGFVIDDDIKATWALKKIREIERETDRQIAWYKDNIKKYEEYRENRTAYFKGLLYRYFQTVPVRKTKTKDSYKMPDGELILKRGKRDFSFDKDNKAALLDELKAAKIGFIKTKEEVDWNALKKGLVEVEGNVCFVDEDGTVTRLENVVVVEKLGEFVVKLEGSDS